MNDSPVHRTIGAVVVTWILGGLGAIVVLIYIFRRPFGRRLKKWLNFDFPSLPPGCG
jgi:hypothetical protein